MNCGCRKIGGIEATGGHGDSQFLDEVFVPGAMGEENFHRVLDLSELQSAASRDKKQLENQQLFLGGHPERSGQCKQGYFLAGPCKACPITPANLPR